MANNTTIFREDGDEKNGTISKFTATCRHTSPTTQEMFEGNSLKF